MQFVLDVSFETKHTKPNARAPADRRFEGAHTGLTDPLFTKIGGLSQGLSALHPFRGLGEPEDIARAILFLASEDNSWMTGAMMTVDGGYTTK